MWKWIKQTTVAAIFAGGSYLAYDTYRAGYHTRPDMPAGAFSISYKNGMRAILVDVPNEQDTRRYLGIPMKVPFYLEETWSLCFPPSNEDKLQAAAFIGKRELPGERFEAICKIDVVTEVVVRGFITSVPRL